MIWDSRHYAVGIRIQHGHTSKTAESSVLMAEPLERR